MCLERTVWWLWTRTWVDTVDLRCARLCLCDDAAAERTVCACVWVQAGKVAAL